MNIVNGRTPEYDIEDIFLKRWSPRAMDGRSLTKEIIMKLFEAARWAPSASNNQPWRFIYALASEDNFRIFLSLLSEGNLMWAKKAGALIVVISDTVSEKSGRTIYSHSFDTGAAWENLALQGTLDGLVVHGLGGFDHEKTRAELNIPERFRIEMMIAAGYPGKKEDLPPTLQKRELPSGRKNLEEIVNAGKFGNS